MHLRLPLLFLVVSFNCLIGYPAIADKTVPPTPYEVPLTDEVKLPDKTFELNQPAIYELPSLPAKAGLIPVFRAHIYLKQPAAGGFNVHAQVQLNGSILNRRMSSGQERLLLRSQFFRHGVGAYQVFNPTASGGDLLATMFAPNPTVANSITSDNLGGTFLFNLSDLARGVDGNTLEVIGKAAATVFGMGQVQDASVGWISSKLLTANTPTPLVREMPADQVEKDGVVLGVGKAGGVAIDFQNTRLCLETSDDIPKKNTLIVSDQTNAALPVTLSSPAKDELAQEIAWPGGLNLKRTFKIADKHHIQWTETWTNTTENDLPVPFNDRFFFSGRLPGPVWIGGNPDSEYLVAAQSNPTVFLGDSSHGAGFGWTAEDDWLRNLIQLTRDSLGGNVFTRNLALGPHKSISFEMSIQLLPSDSYWDFINDLRMRWGSNSVRLDAAVFWGLALPGGGKDYDDPKALVAAVADKGPLYAWIPPWLASQSDAKEAIALDARTKGRPLSVEEIRKFYQFKHRILDMEAMEKGADLLKKEPNVKVMEGMHPSMDVAYKPLLNEYPFHDELIIDATGKPFEDHTYDKAWLKGAMDHGWGILYAAPLPGSLYSAELLRRMTEALDVYKLDAIYCDEFTFSGMRNYSRYDYKSWDGYSVQLDDHGKIVAKATDMALATKENQMAMIYVVKKRDKVLLVNGAPATRDVQQAGIWHFVEGGNGLWYMCNTNLSTPLVLGNVGHPKSQEDVFKLSLGILGTGNLHVLCNTNLFVHGPDNFITKQYPITPQRVGPGFVVGLERLITSKSKSFAWPGRAAEIKIYKYDARGNLIGVPSQETIGVDGHFQANVPENGLLIAELEPAK